MGLAKSNLSFNCLFFQIKLSSVLVEFNEKFYLIFFYLNEKNLKIFAYVLKIIFKFNSLVFF